MISGDDWFTKTMFINSVNRNAALKESVGKALLEGNGSDSFADILSEMIVDKLENAIKDNTPLPIAKSMPAPLTNRVPRPVLTQGTLQFEPTSSEKLDQLLDGKLKNMGSTYIQAGQHYNINPALLAAISMHETGNGSSQAAQNKNNVAGMMGKDGLKAYHSVEESIWDMARNLSQNYLGEGIQTINAIGAKYAPIGADNDPTHLNNYWISGVTKYFNRING